MCAQPGVHRSRSAHLNSHRVHKYALAEESSTRMDLSRYLGVAQ